MFLPMLFCNPATHFLHCEKAISTYKDNVSSMGAFGMRESCGKIFPMMAPRSN